MLSGPPSAALQASLLPLVEAKRQSKEQEEFKVLNNLKEPTPNLRNTCSPKAKNNNNNNMFFLFTGVWGAVGIESGSSNLASHFQC